MDRKDYPQKVIPETAVYPALILAWIGGVLFGHGRRELVAIGVILLAAALFLTVTYTEKRA